MAKSSKHTKRKGRKPSASSKKTSIRKMMKHARVKEIRKTLQRNQARTKKLVADLNKALIKEQTTAAVLHAALVVSG